MAIYWNEGPQAGSILYEGCVLSTHSRERQIMSDVYDTEYYALVWNGHSVGTYVLSDWAYPKIGGGWTKFGEEAVKTERESFHYQDNKRVVSKYMGSDIRNFTPMVVIDATEEVRAAAAEWNQVNYAIQNTEANLRMAMDIQHGREVKVFKGKKVPLGVYEVVNITEGNFGPQANLRDKAGNRYNYIALGNMVVNNPTQYVLGEATCRECRKTYDSAQKAGMEAGHYALAICKTCRDPMILAGRHEVPHPSWAKSQGCRLTQGLEGMVGTGLGEIFLRDIITNPEDTLTWMAWVDWLLETYPERGEMTRLAIFGEEKIIRKPLRKKDLTATPWELVYKNNYGVRIFRSVITGIPEHEECKEIWAEISFCCVTQKIPAPTLHKHKDCEEGISVRYHNLVKGTLLRVAKSALPPFPYTLEEVKAL
jgi:hypothetical protein